MSEDSQSAGQIEHENRPYAFRSYDSSWPQQFEKIAEEIRSVFGDSIVELEHVGSTSIQGLSAKPQIDVLVTVRDFAGVPRYYPQMESRGYTPRGDYTNEGEEYFTKDVPSGARLASVHILPAGHRWAVDLIDFRDYLRTHPNELALYDASKQKAHDSYPDDYTNYYKSKLKIVHELRHRAAEWRGHKIQ